MPEEKSLISLGTAAVGSRLVVLFHPQPGEAQYSVLPALVVNGVRSHPDPVATGGHLEVPLPTAGFYTLTLQLLRNPPQPSKSEIPVIIAAAAVGGANQTYLSTIRSLKPFVFSQIEVRAK